MSKCYLKAMEIENFKGISKMSLLFGSKLTELEGPNGSGKTSIVDAYLWTLTGKDSNGNENFKVQPVDKFNVTIPKVITRVSVVLIIHGIEKTFERTLSQKWSTPKGTAQEVLKGNESSFSIDGIPMTSTEYKKKVEELVCNGEDFKLMSSISYFFTLSVEKKREKLMEMAGTLPNIMSKELYPHIFDKIAGGMSVDNVKKMASMALSSLNKRKDEIPSRLSENERNMPEGIDFDYLREKKAEIESEIKRIDLALQRDVESAQAAYDARNAIYEKLSDVQRKIVLHKNEADIQAEIAHKSHNAKIASKESELSSLKAMLNSYQQNLDISLSVVEKYKAKISELSEKWIKENNTTYDDKVDECCPTCGKPFDAAHIQEVREAMIKAFNTGKVAKLDAIVEEGNKFRAKLDEANAELSKNTLLVASQKDKIEDAERELISIKEEVPCAPTPAEILGKDKEYAELVAQENSIKEELLAIGSNDSTNVSELKNNKHNLNLELQSVISSLSAENRIADVINRREELKKEANNIANEIAEQEQILFELGQYTKAYISMVEESVSSMFSLVKFQMYEQNLTNDGEKKICECLVNGVPYSLNLNSAARVNAGVDIVNAISKWKGIYVPMFVDNKETVTKLLDTDAQVITLSVVDTPALSVVNSL